ncbi:hypothetical protein [uncultured Aliiroseovarius sp.]|nr:hypothetical protein [uncultured Aliiroseovarius sp.]
MEKKIEETAIMGAGFVSFTVRACTFWNPRTPRRDADVGDIVEKIFK